MTQQSLKRPTKLLPAVPLITSIAAFAYAAVAAAVVVLGGRLPLADPAAPAEHAPLNGPLGDVLHWVLPALAVLGGGLALAIHVRRRPGRLLAGAAVTFAVVYAGITLLLVVDSRLLTMLGYVPFLLINFLVNPGSLDIDFHWPIVGHQAAVLAGVAMWVGTAVVAVRRSVGACLACGRGNNRFTAASARRWGKPVTIAAAVIPAAYALTRFAWAAGIPLGLSTELLSELQAGGGVYAGLGLASMALLGTLLTLGLIQRWGSVFPRWVPFIGGRSVPVLLAVIPASLVSVVVVPAGTEIIRLFTADITGGVPFDAENWATGAPAFLWIVWGPLLAAATLAYYLKRRGQCGICGQSA
ncbi:hypothetical protein BJ994_002817 [Arthrobacter pigmenti]|uniref:Uncharacterized protein n=1 Tax=Arthrobacter pigmenti TaxID=271432 RepID=A0A846RZY9_9MICC|nr:hypothetical protein [Arthrobacter pigmenti]NJC23741.1 hypothetical protein [Arthrobacter pigmenti]